MSARMSARLMSAGISSSRAGGGGWSRQLTAAAVAAAALDTNNLAHDPTVPLPVDLDYGAIHKEWVCPSERSTGRTPPISIRNARKRRLEAVVVVRRGAPGG